MCHIIGSMFRILGIYNFAFFLLQGTNLRQTVIDVMDKLQDYMLKNHADDHKSLSMLISAYEHSLQSFGISRIELEHHRNRSAIFRGFFLL